MRVLPPVNYGPVLNHGTEAPRPQEPGWPGKGITQPFGSYPAFIQQAKVEYVNYTAWTVDVRTVFDNRLYRGVQVSSPFFSSLSGAGGYRIPSIGDKCSVAVPSDGVPYITCFIASIEQVSDAAAEAGITTTYAAGRPRPKGGDIGFVGEDGNFLILHRGGILQIGGTQLSQRLYIPLGNLIVDICEAYELFNAAGSIKWGIQELGGELVGENTQTFRVYANTAYADVRLKVGKCTDLVGDGDAATAAGLGISEEDTWVELCLSRDGFEEGTGKARPDAAKNQVLRIVIDKNGGLHARLEGPLHLHTKKSMVLEADEGITLKTKKAVTIEADEGMRITGGKSLELGTDGGSTKINGGQNPVAYVGSAIKGVLPIGTILYGVYVPPTPTSPGMFTLQPSPMNPLSSGVTVEGMVATGNHTVLV